MRRKVHWASSASNDLIELMEFVAEHRPESAARLGASVLDAGESLARHPFKGRVVPELANVGVSEYRRLLVDVYRLVYRVREETIEILVVADSRRDLASLLLRRLLRL